MIYHNVRFQNIIGVKDAEYLIAVLVGSEYVGCPNIDCVEMRLGRRNWGSGAMIG